MKRIVLTIAAVCLSPLLSGCCCCGTSGDYGGYSSYSGGNYGNCLTYQDSYAGGGKNCNCKGSDDFSLPPEGTSYPVQTGVPYGTTYGPEIVGPEIVGPEYVPNDAQWQVAPPVPGSSIPVTPAPGTASSGPTPLLPPAPIPQISNGSSVVVPPPAPPYSPASNSGDASGPMMPTVPPPPPEPVSQMRFRQYR